MEQEQGNHLMGFKRVKMKIIKQACQMHIRKIMRSHSHRECKTQIKTLRKWMTHQLLTNQTVRSQMKRTTMKMNLKANLLKSHYSRFIQLRM